MMPIAQMVKLGLRETKTSQLVELGYVSRCFIWSKPYKNPSQSTRNRVQYG